MSRARSGRSRRALRWFAVNDRWAHAALFVFFGVLVITGTTTSNLTQDYLQAAVDGRQGVLFGAPQEIRWDEYLSGTPLYTSIMATHGLPATSPLAEQAGLAMRYSEGGFFGSLVFFDGTLLRLAGILPEPMLFSLHWWLPTVLFLACMPVWFRQLGFSSRAGWLAGLVIAASPSVAWWSIQPVNIMGFTLAGCTALLAGFRRVQQRQLVRAAFFASCAAVLLASMPSAYLIWALILSLPLLIVSSLQILLAEGEGSARSTRWIYLGTVGAVTLGLALGALADVRRGVAALSSTVYPGDRRAASAPTPFEALFGAPVSGAASGHEISPEWGAVTGITNHSELAMSLTVSFVVLAVLGLRLWPLLTGSSWRDWAPVSALLAWGSVWLAWSAVSLGDFSARLPVLSQVPSLRSAQVVGILGVLAVCLTIPRMRSTVPQITTVSVVAGLVTLYAGSLLQRAAVPDMSSAGVWGAAIGVAAALYIFGRWHGQVWAVAVVAVLAFLPVASSGVVSVGLGSYRQSAPAEYIQSAAPDARAAGDVWASDFRAMDAMMLANGMPSLTGQQLSGPVRSEWLKLDPDGSDEDAWNRGGSRVRATWRDEAGISITSNGYNVVTIDANPCSLHEAYPRLTTILSREARTDGCLREAQRIPWKDGTVRVYEFIGEGN